MQEPDERLWQLDVTACSDGDILLSQGECACGCGDEVLVRLHRSHIPLVAEMAGLVPESEVSRATERLQDRLDLLAGLVLSHCPPGHPLRAAVGVALGREACEESSYTSAHESALITSAAKPQTDASDNSVRQAKQLAIGLDQ